MSNEQQLTKDLLSVIQFCFANHKLPKMKIGTSDANYGTRLLGRVADHVRSSLAEQLEGFEVKFSRGSGYFPKVPWVGIVPRGKKVSETMSVTICFSKDGTGLVVGAMFPYPVKDDQYGTQEIPLDGECGINLKGGKHSTHYNKKYVNPNIMMKNSVNADSLLGSIKQSLKILNAFQESKRRF